MVKVKSDVQPNPIWIQYVEDGVATVRLRSHITEDVNLPNGFEDTENIPTMFEYEELIIRLTYRDNLLEYIQNNFDEIYRIALNKQKADKIQNLKEQCQAEIYSGFYSNGYRFGFDSKDQVNFNSQLNKINNLKTSLLNEDITQEEYDSYFPIPWKTDNLGIVSLSESEFNQVVADAEAHTTDNQQKYWILESFVKNAELGSYIEDVDWNEPLNIGE